TPGPEGVLPVPSRDLLVISSEADEAENRVRASINVYGYGDQYATAGGKPPFPSIISGDVDGAPIPWGALGALSADPADENRLYASPDIAVGPSRILGIDLSKTPALIDTALPITEDGKPVTLDIEGVSARSDGGFVLAVEGEEGPGNQLAYVAADGKIEKKVSLPGDIAGAMGGQGLEGVAVDGDSVWVAVQREIKGDPAGVVRIGRYTPDGDKWEWFGYQLDKTDVEGDWIGLSEIAVHDGNLLVLERDKMNGPDARVKAIYRVAIPTDGGVASAGEAPKVLPKTLARNLLPDLQATDGFVQEKVEGFAIAGNQKLYVVTDNDGLDDANGETQFLDLGPAGEALKG
ncbi:MAG TPA: esterase-like activity of phytase family protein, partial [Mycobacterium sp.]